MLEVGVVRTPARTGVADQRIDIPAAQLPVQLAAELAIVGVGIAVLAQDLVLGGGVGHVLEHSDAVVTQRGAVVVVDAVQRAAAGG